MSNFLSQFLSAYTDLCPGAGVVIQSRGNETHVDISAATEQEVRAVAERLGATVEVVPGYQGTWYQAKRGDGSVLVTVSAKVRASKEAA